MKHPALTRVLAIVLVLLCLTMAAAGALGLTRAGKDRRSTLEEMQRLRARIEEYETVSAELADTQSYEERSASLDERQKSHSSSSAEHRSELSTFTLTQYGLGVGTEAIDEADRQFAQFKALFRADLRDEEKVFLDVKSLYRVDELKASGMSFWRL